MSERDEHRSATRERQGLVWLPRAPGWDRLLDTLSHTAELHGPREWTVTSLDEKRGRLHFSSIGGDSVSEGLEAFAGFMSARTCHRCGAPGRTRGYGPNQSAAGQIPTRIETRCARCHRAEAGTDAPGDEGSSAERHAPTEWTVRHLDQKMGHLRFEAAGGNEVTRALEAFAMEVSAHTCFECGAPGSTRGYDPMPDLDGEGTTPSRRETRCERCHEAELKR